MKTSFLSWTMALVAASALIACGDDTGTGTGGSSGQGGNGDGGDGTTTAGPTTTSGATTTASTTTTSSTGGDGGGGGDTTSQGGAGGTGGGDGGSGGGFVNPGCTEVTIEELEGQVDNVLFGNIAPALGGADPDFGLIEFWNVDFEGNPVNGFEAGEYDLSEETSYADCGRCILAYEDATQQAIGRTYFQEQGTLVLAEEGNAVAFGYGTVTLTNVILREAEIGAGGTTTFVEDGECLYIADLTYDVPSPAPAEWECDPARYGDDSCTCSCGAVDSDCEPGNTEPELCDASQTCGDDATCEGDLAGCATPTEINASTFSGNTINDVLEPGTTCALGTGGTQVFSFTAATAGEHTFTVNPVLGDVAIGVRADCNQLISSSPDEDNDSQDPFCADDGGALGAESFTTTLAVGEEIFLVVQAYSNTTEGGFTGTVDEP